MCQLTSNAPHSKHETKEAGRNGCLGPVSCCMKGLGVFELLQIHWLTDYPAPEKLRHGSLAMSPVFYAAPAAVPAGPLRYCYNVTVS